MQNVQLINRNNFRLFIAENTENYYTCPVNMTTVVTLDKIKTFGFWPLILSEKEYFIIPMYKFTNTHQKRHFHVNRKLYDMLYMYMG